MINMLSERMLFIGYSSDEGPKIPAGEYLISNFQPCIPFIQDEINTLFCHPKRDIPFPDCRYAPFIQTKLPLTILKQHFSLRSKRCKHCQDVGILLMVQSSKKIRSLELDNVRGIAAQRDRFRFIFEVLGSWYDKISCFERAS